MKKWTIVLLVLVGLMLIAVPLVSAENHSPPVGDCPDGFQLHMVGDHDHEHEGQHKHVGNDRDLNGDGWICGKHVGGSGSVHVHTDNNAQLPE